MPSLACKFGTACTNVACKFPHPDGKKAARTEKRVQDCRHGDKCTHKNTPEGCKFGHPETTKAAAEPATAEPKVEPKAEPKPKAAPKSDAKAAPKSDAKADPKRKADFTIGELIAACPALADAIVACPALADALAAARVAAEATRRANELVKQFSKSS